MYDQIDNVIIRISGRVLQLEQALAQVEQRNAELEALLKAATTPARKEKTAAKRTPKG